VPISTSGELSIMPPATGLPAPRSSSLAPFIDAVPHMDAANGQVEAAAANGLAQKPMRYTNHLEEDGGAPVPEAGRVR